MIEDTLLGHTLALFLLAIPVACVSWTLTHEEVFREAHDWCVRKSRESGSLFTRKFFYLFTCEYCLSHYVTVFFLAITRFTLLFPDWRGYLIAGFSLVWVANMYMNFFGRLRLEIKYERAEATVEEETAKRLADTPPA